MAESYAEALKIVEHRPYALPAGKWRMRQRWNDLLFAHWPVATEEIERLLPAGLEVDLYGGSAWIGVVPFWMDEVQVRAVGERTVWFPTTRTFPELNLRTYVRSRKTGLAGVYFFSLDCASWLAVAGARTLFHLPYFPAAMSIGRNDDWIEYRSRRVLGGKAEFAGRYRGTGARIGSGAGSLEHFLTERYCLFTASRGRLLVGHIHHVPWPLERAEAEFGENGIAASFGIGVGQQEPVLHYSRELRVAIWGLREEYS